MGTSKYVKCKICNKKYVSKQALIGHIETSHSTSIPEGWNAARYENYLRTGKTEGRCVYCKKETGWNDATGKYNRMCGSEACKKLARETANKNYIGLHGKPYSINDPEQQKKMIYGRKNSGKYIFEDDDGKKYEALYDSSYGRDFFEMIDTFLNWDGKDIIAPSPHTYWYEYEGKKHFYIPDAYSTSLNLEIEFKDGGDNPNKHPKIQAVDKVKEEKKDAVMNSLKGQVNYIKICNKDYTEFFALLSELKEKDVCKLPKWESKLEPITEGRYLYETMGSVMGFVDLDSARIPIEEASRSIDRISFSKEFRYVKEIVDSLSQKDKMYICNGEFKKSPYTKYRNVLMVNNRPASFIEVYELPQDKGVGYIVVATKKDKRGFGYSKQLVNEFLSSSESRQFDTIAWKYHDGNNVSLKFAQSVGFGHEKDNTLYYYPSQSIIEGNNRIIAQNKIPIYIISWNYSSLVGMGVKVVTRSEYNHTSISLVPDIEQCYTFSRNPQTVTSHSNNGFCKEPASYMINRYGHPNIKVTAVYVSKTQYDNLKRNIEEYIKKQDDTSFDYINFLCIFFKIPRKELNEDKLNCSVFVDLILKKSGIDLTKGKPSNLVTPNDLSELKNYGGETSVIYEGDASKYHFVEDNKMVKPQEINISESHYGGITESTYIEATKNDTVYYPVFIFLSYTDTNIAKLIKAYTHDPYAHSSLSFDTELKDMVSFDARGIIKENIFTDVYKDKSDVARYSLYAYMATASEYDAMKAFVNDLLNKQSKMKYNILGLTNFIFGKGSERENKFFCSEFVASVINAGNNKIIKTKPYLTSPYMLAKNNNFIFIKTGILKNYNSKIVDHIFAEKLEEGGFTNVIVK